MIGRATIRLGIGPHSSFVGFCSSIPSKPRDWLGERLLNDLFCDDWDVKP